MESITPDPVSSFLLKARYTAQGGLVGSLLGAALSFLDPAHREIYEFVGGVAGATVILIVYKKLMPIDIY